MKAKLKTSVLLVSLFAIMSSMTAGFAAEYSVHDDEVRSNTKNIDDKMETLNEKVQNIEKMLQVIRDKELSMDILDKAAVQRKNDSMAKLTDGDLTGFKLNSNGFVSTQTYQGQEGLEKLAKSIGLGDYLNTGFNIPNLPGLGNNKPDFKTIFMGQITDMLGQMNTRGSTSSKPGSILQEEYNNTMDKYIDLAKPEYYKGSDSDLCDRLLVDANNELDKGIAEISEKKTKLIDNTHAAKAVLDKNAGEIGKAKPDADSGSNVVFQKLSSNSNLKLLQNGMNLNDIIGVGQLKGIGDLSDNANKILFNSANTGSVVAAEQETAMMEALSFSRDSLQMNMDIQLKSYDDQIELLEAIRVENRKNYDTYKAKAQTKRIEDNIENNINKTGTKYTSPWEKEFGKGLFGF